MGNQRVLAVYQAMLSLLRESSAARIVNVSSGVGSLTTNADPSHPYHASYSLIYPASKAALNAITLAMMIELESTGIKIGELNECQLERRLPILFLIEFLDRVAHLQASRIKRAIIHPHEGD